MTFPVETLRKDFPILSQTVYDKPLVYLDSAASMQTPTCVVEAIARYYEVNHSNVHRGVHALSAQATEAYESARNTVQNFIKAEHREEIIFTRGTTEAINLVAHGFSQLLKPDDEIIISEMAHHSNIVPWQLACERSGARLRVIPVKEDGSLDIAAYCDFLNEKTKLVAVGHVSNALGTINPVADIVEEANKYKVPVLLDGAQAASHIALDMKSLGCAFYAFSGHKLPGPTGIGVLYGQRKWLERLPVYQGGGEMIAEVSLDHSTYNVLPHRFEAGTPNISGAVGLAAAIDYIEAIGLESIAAYEHELLARLEASLSDIPKLRYVGTASPKTAVCSFVFDDIHAHDVGTILDREGVAVRAGHHCAMPLMAKFQVPATVRASLAFYNTFDEVDALHRGLLTVRELLG